MTPPHTSETQFLWVIHLQVTSGISAQSWGEGVQAAELLEGAIQPI